MIFFHYYIGCAFTRFQTKRLHKAFPNVLTEQLVSYGPCQFPTLGFVVDRVSCLLCDVVETDYKKVDKFLYSSSLPQFTRY